MNTALSGVRVQFGEPGLPIEAAGPVSLITYWRCTWDSRYPVPAAYHGGSGSRKSRYCESFRPSCSRGYESTGRGEKDRYRRPPELRSRDRQTGVVETSATCQGRAASGVMRGHRVLFPRQGPLFVREVGSKRSESRNSGGKAEWQNTEKQQVRV